MATAYPNRNTGFTLVELTIVVVLIGIVMTMGLKTLNATIDNSIISETKAKQERIKMAFISYLRTKGHLPCPDISGETVVATGVAPASCKTSLADGYGVVPWQELGIPRDAVIDGWGNYFTYRVANGTGGSKNWTEKTAPSTDMTINELKNPTDALTVRELNNVSNGLVDVTKQGVVVILSHGKNGFGAKTTKVGARILADEAGADEVTNSTVGTAVFVRRPVTDGAGGSISPYDDFVAYMLPQDLLQPLINEGTLKACAAYCATSVCPVASETCQCTAMGLPGIPGGASPCSALCTECVPPITAGCSPLISSQIPVGAKPLTCS